MANKNLKIMIVEDEPLLLKAIAKKMSVLEIDTILCSGGEQALELLKKGQIPDVIWLDYYLQDMNGLEFCQHVKSHPKLKKIPILVVSNSASPDKVDSMLALGVNDYLLKAEHRLDDIINIIRKMLK